MRTTILLSTLLFLAGSALAQDSPITVGDSSRPPKPGTSLQHKQFNGNGDNYHVRDPRHTAACFEVVGGPPPVSLDLQWTLALNDGVVLTTTDGNRVDIVYNGRKPDQSTLPGGDQQHKLTGAPLTSGWLINGGKATLYPAGAFTSPLTFVIHYCTPKSGGTFDCTDTNGKNACP
jgi:hypothetical protein